MTTPESDIDLKVTDTQFPVSEMFESIQGEGNCAGVNCLFVRFQLCNLRCPWCDTKYTWTRFSDTFNVFKQDELKQAITRHQKYHVVFTGGEPSLYRLDLLRNPNVQYHVETNGTIVPTLPLDLHLEDGVVVQREGMDEAVIRTFNWVVSPKLSNSGQPVVSEAMTYWAGQAFSTFKFIAHTHEDLDEVEAFVAEFDIPKNKTYIGLLGTTIESQLRPDFVDTIIQRGFHVSPRLHILLWGQAREK